VKVLMIDVGGTNVKLMAAGHEGFRKIPSGQRLTGAAMVKKVLAETEDWDFEAITLGFPGLVRDGKIERNPLNLGGGWQDFDFAKAFKRPVQVINDAAMQALAFYTERRMLFIGLGTSIGATLIADDTVVPMEIGMMRLGKNIGFMDRISKEALRTGGKRRWQRAVARSVELLRDIFSPDHLVIGGGNADVLDPFPAGCERGNNQDAFRGALRLWPGSDMLAEPYGTTWRIKHKAVPKTKKGK
jgi:polyphosphate glucokinase